jgi:membrane dipeptidase
MTLDLPPRAPSRYSGYRSWGYLTPGADFRQHELISQRNRVEEYTVPLDDAQRARLTRLFDEGLVISLHDHVTVFPSETAEIPDYIRSGRVETAFDGLRMSGMDVVFDNLAGPTGCITSAHGWKWSDTVVDIGLRLADLAKQDYVALALSVDDILSARASGRVAMVLGLESATPIENELDRLDMLYGFGVRQMGVVYNDTNTLGSGLKEPHDGGLTRFGRRAVERMNKLGIMIDISHAGDRTGLETVDASATPVAITHAGARGVWPSERMKPDEVLRAVAARGGVIGIEAAPTSTVSPQRPGQDIESVMDHFDYCVELMGIDHVTFGPDTIYADHTGFHDVMPDVFPRTTPHPSPDDDPLSRIGVKPIEPRRIDYVEGVENPTEAMRNLTSMLILRGYADDDIAKVLGGNTMRILREIW